MSEPKVLVDDRSITYPGQLIAEGTPFIENTFREDGKTFSLVKGLCRVNGKRIDVIPLSGTYKPKSGDYVVGVIQEDFGGVYLVNIKAPYYGILKGLDRDTRAPDLNVGDVVNCKIFTVDEVNEPQLGKPWKLSDGFVIEFPPKKVPRLIGKKKSMINLLKDKTRCNISVGQNGLVWLKGEKTEKAIEAINMINEQAHTSGLTDRITKFLNEQ